VDVFINQYSNKSNLMIIIAKFVEFLCTKWNEKWPKGISEVYIQAYIFMRYVLKIICYTILRLL